MPYLRLFSALLFSLLFTACGNLPTESGRGSDDIITVSQSGPSQALDPVVVIGTCDPYLSLDRCGQEEDCMTSMDVAPALGDFSTLSGCGTGGGGTSGPGDGGGTGVVGGTTPGTATPPPPSTSAYREGPLTWGICVLTILGSAYSIDQVAGAFQGWWTAQMEYESAKRMLDAIQANSQNIDPATMQLWEFQVEYHRKRRDDAMAVVSEKTGASYWALATAALGCGAALFLPTP
jgi:hypothetical protein